jgi:hypothetical protein
MRVILDHWVLCTSRLEAQHRWAKFKMFTDSHKGLVALMSFLYGMLSLVVDINKLILMSVQSDYSNH